MRGGAAVVAEQDLAAVVAPQLAVTQVAAEAQRAGGALGLEVLAMRGGALFVTEQHLAAAVAHLVTVRELMAEAQVALSPREAVRRVDPGAAVGAAGMMRAARGTM
jgi:hypothetical protein